MTTPPVLEQLFPLAELDGVLLSEAIAMVYLRLADQQILALRGQGKFINIHSDEAIRRIAYGEDGWWDWVCPDHGECPIGINPAQDDLADLEEVMPELYRARRDERQRLLLDACRLISGALGAGNLDAEGVKAQLSRSAGIPRGYWPLSRWMLHYRESELTTLNESGAPAESPYKMVRLRVPGIGDTTEAQLPQPVPVEMLKEFLLQLQKETGKAPPMRKSLPLAKIAFHRFNVTRKALDAVHSGLYGKLPPGPRAKAT